MTGFHFISWDHKEKGPEPWEVQQAVDSILDAGELPYFAYVPDSGGDDVVLCVSSSASVLGDETLVQRKFDRMMEDDEA